MKTRDIILLLTITIIWGLNFSIIKLGLSTLDPFMITALRFLLVAFPLILFIKKPDINIIYLISYGLLFGVGLWGMVTLGIHYGISAGLASLLLQSSVFFTLILSSFWLKEKLKLNNIIAFIFALFGIILVFNVTDGSVTLIGAMLVILGAIAWAITNIIVKKANTTDMFAFIVWSSIFSPIPLFFLSYLTNGLEVFSEFFINIDSMAIFSIMFQVYPTTLFGYWVWNKLLKKYQASYVVPFSLLVPFFGLLGSYLIFNEDIGTSKIFAGILIVCGLLINIYGQKINDVFKYK